MMVLRAKRQLNIAGAGAAMIPNRRNDCVSPGGADNEGETANHRGCVMPESFDPYRVWLSIPPESRPPTHYQLLGISPEECDPTVINAAVLRQSGYVRNFQIGKYAEAAARVLSEIQAAKACLLDPAKRARYDAELRAAQPLAVARQTAAIAAQVYPVSAPAIDLDALASAAYAQDVPGRAPARRLPTRFGKPRNKTALAWQLPAGVFVGLLVVVALIAFSLPPGEPAAILDERGVHIKPVEVANNDDVRASPNPVVAPAIEPEQASTLESAPPLAVAPFSADQLDSVSVRGSIQPGQPGMARSTIAGSG